MNKTLTGWISESIKNKLFAEVYDLGRELGRGASATVYLCTHKKSKQSWAVKRITKKYSNIGVMIEVGVLLKLNHQNVIRMKEVYETPKVLDLVLELATGGELFERIETKQNYSEKDASYCTRMFLNGVKYLHENSILHRDLKPENLLYETTAPDANLKIADFGLAKILGPNLKAMSLCGTPSYCAPEVLKQENYTFSVDMWSVGVIIFILLGGYEPFYCENNHEMFKRILRCDFEFESPWWDEVSENAKDIIRRLLVKDPNKRLTAAQALKHHWVMGVAARNFKKSLTQENIKQFNHRRKFKEFATICVKMSRVIKCATPEKLLGTGISTEQIHKSTIQE